MSSHGPGLKRRLGTFKELWHRLRPLLSRWLGEKRLERFLYALRFYQLKSRLLIQRRSFPEGIELWVREPDVGIVNGVLVQKSYASAEVHPGDVVLDVGAHVGSYTVWASKRVGPGGKVLSFEPEPENFRLLKKNIALNGCSNVRLYSAALSEVPGRIRLFVSEPPELHSLMPVSGAAIEVPSLRLDDVAAELGLERVGTIKIDAEGAELRILSAARQTLTRTREVIMELHKLWVSEEAVRRLLEESGMECEVLGDHPAVVILHGRRRGA